MNIFLYACRVDVEKINGLTITSGFLKNPVFAIGLGEGILAKFQVSYEWRIPLLCIMIGVINLWSTQHNLCLQISFCERKKGKDSFCLCIYYQYSY